MQVHFVVSGPGQVEEIRGYDSKADHFLFSYFFVNSDKAMARIAEQKKKGARFVLDSGAFSSMTLGRPINLKNYIDFVSQHKDLFEWYITLDVIGSAPKTIRNYDEMRAAKLAPVFVEHMQGSPLSDGDRKRCYSCSPRVALGGFKTDKAKQSLGKTNLEEQGKRVDACLNHARGMKKDTHALAIFRSSFLKRFKFSSIDTSSWVSGRKFGSLMVFRVDDEGIFSTGSVHFSQATPDMKKAASSMGVDFKDGNGRCKWGVKFFLTFSKVIQAFHSKGPAAATAIVKNSPFFVPKVEKRKSFVSHEDDLWIPKAVEQHVMFLEGTKWRNPEGE